MYNVSTQYRTDGQKDGQKWYINIERLTEAQ